MQEIDGNRHPPQAQAQAEAGSIPVTVAVTGYMENRDDRCPSDDEIFVIETARGSDVGCILLFILTVGVLLLLVALAQALLASDVKKNVSTHSVSRRHPSFRIENALSMIPRWQAVNGIYL